MKQFYYLTVVLFATSSIIIGIYNFINEGVTGALRGFVGLLFLLILPIGRRILKIKPAYSTQSSIIIFCFLAFSLGVSLSLYRKLEYYDLFVHGLSGVLFTAIGMCVLLYLRKDRSKPIDHEPLITIVFSFCFSALIAVGWEIGEYVYSIVTGIDVQFVKATGVGDTMEDMMICLAGSIFMIIIMIRRLYFKKRSALIRPIEDFYNINIKEK